MVSFYIMNVLEGHTTEYRQFKIYNIQTHLYVTEIMECIYRHTAWDEALKSFTLLLTRLHCFQK